MQQNDLLKIMHGRAFIYLGLAGGEHMCLFWNPADQKCNIALVSDDYRMIHSIVEESFRGARSKLSNKHRRRALRNFEQVLLNEQLGGSGTVKFSVTMNVYYTQGQRSEKIKECTFEYVHDISRIITCKDIVVPAAEEILKVINDVEELNVSCKQLSLEFVVTHKTGQQRTLNTNLHSARSILVEANILPPE